MKTSLIQVLAVLSLVSAWDQQDAPKNRRTFFTSAGGVTAAAFIDCDHRAAWAADMPTSPGCQTTSDPGKTVVYCRGELLKLDAAELRLSGIASTENGVSTSAIKNPSRYSPPWTYLTETSDPQEAWKSLARAVVEAGATIEKQTDKYLHATAPTTFPPGLSGDAGMDDIEFLLRPEDNLVLYRSASRSTIYVYPLTQPVSDKEANKKRLTQIQNILGWEEMK
jgi:uncharacterized protein (DUF1499 family)